MTNHFLYQFYTNSDTFLVYQNVGVFRAVESMKTDEKLPKRRLQVSLTDEQILELQKTSEETGVSKSAIIAMAISDWMSRRNAQRDAMRV